MIEEQTAKVYYSTEAKRRYFTKAAAIRAEARALIKERHPTEDSDHDDYGRMTYQGWNWRELPNAEKLYSRVCRLIKRNFDNQRKA